MLSIFYYTAIHEPLSYCISYLEISFYNDFPETINRCLEEKKKNKRKKEEKKKKRKKRKKERKRNEEKQSGVPMVIKCFETGLCAAFLDQLHFAIALILVNEVLSFSPYCFKLGKFIFHEVNFFFYFYSFS